MLDYLFSQHGKRLSINDNERMELKFLRKEVPRMMQALKEKYNDKSTSESSSSSCSSDESEENVEDLPKKSVAVRKHR